MTLLFSEPRGHFLTCGTEMSTQLLVMCVRPGVPGTEAAFPPASCPRGLPRLTRGSAAAGDGVRVARMFPGHSLSFCPPLTDVLFGTRLDCRWAQGRSTHGVHKEWGTGPPCMGQGKDTSGLPHVGLTGWVPQVWTSRKPHAEVCWPTGGPFVEKPLPSAQLCKAQHPHSTCDGDSDNGQRRGCVDTVHGKSLREESGAEDKPGVYLPPHKAQQEVTGSGFEKKKEESKRLGQSSEDSCYQPKGTQVSSQKLCPAGRWELCVWGPPCPSLPQHNAYPRGPRYDTDGSGSGSPAFLRPGSLTGQRWSMGNPQAVEMLSLHGLH